MNAEIIYRVALENIENFAHTCIKHPEMLDPRFIAIALKDIELTAQVALQETPEGAPAERLLDIR